MLTPIIIAITITNATETDNTIPTMAAVDNSSVESSVILMLVFINKSKKACDISVEVKFVASPDSGSKAMQ